jgi:hypothetical protein
LELYKEAHARGFVTPAILNNLGFCYILCYLHRLLRFEALDQAQAALRQALEHDDSIGEVFLNLAMIDRLRAIHARASPVLANVEKALSLGIPQAYVEAAYLHAVAATYAKSERQARQYADQAIAHCQESIRLGIAPKDIVERTGSYAPALRERLATLRLTRPSMSVDLRQRLLSPLSETNFDTPLLEI